jgi:cell filamentation protein
MSDYFVDGEALQNKLGIEDIDELNKAEEEIVAARMAELIEEPIQGSFNFRMLQAIHEKLFSDIYDFAGKIRTVRTAKGNSVFCYPEFIEEYQKDIFKQLQKQNYLNDLSRDDFIQQFSVFAGELNALHPFREGNGRTIRLFLRELAENAGWYIAYEDMNAEELLEADIKSFEGDFMPLVKLIEKHITEYK